MLLTKILFVKNTLITINYKKYLHLTYQAKIVIRRFFFSGTQPTLKDKFEVKINRLKMNLRFFSFLNKN